MQAPGFQAIGQETPRILTRGRLEYFFFNFYYDTAKTQPVTPCDPQAYPNYRVLSPSGSLVAQGVAVAGPAPGVWKMGWVVPKNAELTDVNKRYTIQAIIVDEQQRQFEVSFHFDVVDDRIPAQEPELQKLMTFANQPVRVFFKNLTRPQQLSMALSIKGSDIPIHTATLSFPIADPPTTSTIVEVEDKNGLVYYNDTIPLLVGTYSALWTIRESATSPIDFEHQAIQVIGTTTMHLINSVRMLIDKLQKKLGLVYAYSNEDMLEYVSQGANIVNAYWPPSNYTVASYPGAIESFIVLAGAWWGLSSQRILYAETNLNFSGQSVTLDYNPGADIEGILSGFKEFLDSNVSKTKQSLKRASSSAGAIATRPYRFRTNNVFLAETGRGPIGSNIQQLLLFYGLLD